jgi:hypothetical protein
MFKLQKKALQVITGVSNRTSCRQIFKVYYIVSLSSLYLVEVICFIKKILRYFGQKKEQEG